MSSDRIRRGPARILQELRRVPASEEGGNIKEPHRKDSEGRVTHDLSGGPDTSKDMNPEYK